MELKNLINLLKKFNKELAKSAPDIIILLYKIDSRQKNFYFDLNLIIPHIFKLSIFFEALFTKL